MTTDQHSGFNLKAEGKRVLRGSSGGRVDQKANPVEKAKGEYDVVVIGGGLAGLTGANVMAQQGYKALGADPKYAALIKRADEARMLCVWTDEHIVTIDESRIDARPGS